MSYDIETYIQMFPNIEPDTIKIICEQNASPEITLETLLEISNSITNEHQITSNIPEASAPPESDEYNNEKDNNIHNSNSQLPTMPLSNILRGLSFFNNAPTGYKPINNKENDNDQI